MKSQENTKWIYSTQRKRALRKFGLAVQSLQKLAKQDGLDKLTMSDINKMIKAARQARRGSKS